MVEDHKATGLKNFLCLEEEVAPKKELLKKVQRQEFEAGQDNMR